ncbi:MAG: hypothetical protein GWN51_01800, partial [Gemmatimonadetes bacterium]|nr:hypothetical protein [Gemmatimonadota bacterium]NIT66944.1 hypothetical protein [Gemmatimonadota bacterium]NIV22387.1 hypothetical protein [Gemmatimonadota bacterium]NIW74134.1 hypothetical protein [Gemmatimonadota bacterium]NIY35521.1 hypothetical protein [Gemmatimonadota bacterium]
FDSFLDETLEAWWDARAGVIDELRNIPADQWDFRPTPEMRSVEELAVHILEVAMMLTGELTRPDTNLHRTAWPKLLRKYAKPAYRAKGKRELVKLLRSQFRDADRAFREAGTLELYQWMERFDGELGTKLQWLHHGIAQEMYHRGQLTVYARLLGLEPALTQRIAGRSRRHHKR